MGTHVIVFILYALIASTVFLVNEQQSRVKLILLMLKKKEYKGKKNLHYRFSFFIIELQQITFGLCESFGMKSMGALKGDIGMLRAGY